MALKLPRLRLRKKREVVRSVGEVKLPFSDVERPWYLDEYIRKVSIEVGEPELVSKVTSEYKFRREYNIIYPVGNGIFIHVFSKPSESGYNRYYVIEPPRPAEELMLRLEEAIANAMRESNVGKTAEEKIAILLDLINRVVSVVGDVEVRRGRSLSRAVTRGLLGLSNGGRIRVSKREYELVVYHMIRDKVGAGILEPFLRDPYLEDVTCSGLGNIYVVHKIFGALESNVGFKDEAELNRFIISLAEKVGKPISHARPIIDATLPDGSRINIVYGTDVSLRGSNFTIRRISKTPLSITQLIDWGTFDARIAAYMWMMLSEGMSAFICGETASGKTTSLTAMLVFIKPTAKIVSIEDTAEVIVPHPNWTRELTRDTGRPESSVTMFDLLKAALRQRPNYIIVGEIRGAEGNIAFQAMQTGHPVLSTFHAADIDRLIQRLTSHPINVPKTHMDALNIAWFQSAVYTREGFLARRVIRVYEILGYDPSVDNILVMPVFNWDPVTDRFQFSGRGSSYLLEEKIAVMRGIPKKRIGEIYDELELRARFLNLLVEKKVYDYWDVWRAVVKTYQLGLEEAFRRLQRDSLL